MEAKIRSVKECEFSISQTKLIGKLSKDMRFVGIFLLVVSALSVLGGFFEWWLDDHIVGIWYIGWGILNIFIGFWTVNATIFFQRIVDNYGNDKKHLNRSKNIKNLIDGFKEVMKIYELQRWFFLFTLFGLLIVGVFLILVVVVMFMTSN